MKFEAGIEIRYLKGNVEDSNADRVDVVEVYANDEETIAELYAMLKLAAQRFIKRRFSDLTRGMCYVYAWPAKAPGDA
jgi:hypothetical protein